MCVTSYIIFHAAVPPYFFIGYTPILRGTAALSYNQ
jgi:hypothetical protein